MSDALTKHINLQFVFGWFFLSIICSLIGLYFPLHFYMLVWTFYTISRKGTFAVSYIIVFSVFQNIMLILFSQTLTPIDTKLIIFYKEIIVYLIPAIVVLKCGFSRFHRDKLSIFVLVGFILLILFNLAKPSAPFSVRIMSLRQILVPFFCLYLGCAITYTKERVALVMKVYDKYLIFLCIMGLFIMLFPVHIWDQLNFPTYYYNKNGTEFEGLYGNFTSKDFGTDLKRFVSILADPVAMAHLLGLAFFYQLICAKKKSTLCLYGLCCFLCYSKSIIFLIFSAILVFSYMKITKRWLRRLLIIAFVGIGVGSFIFAEVYLNGLEKNTATGNHLMSLFYALNNHTLFGQGLGTTGYMAEITGGDTDIGYNESFFAVLIGQIGDIGTFLYYVFFIIQIRKLMYIYDHTKDPFILFVSIIFIDVVMESFVSGSAVAMLGTSLYFVFAGFALQVYNQCIYPGVDIK